MLSLICFLFLSAAQALTLQNVQVYSYGEKPGLAKASEKASIDLAMARGEYETFILALPNATKPKDSISKVTLNWKDKTPEVELNTYQLFGHNFKSSSFKSIFKAGEVADIPVPLEWINEKNITPPSFSVLSQPQYLFELSTKQNAVSGIFTGELSFVRGKETFNVPVKLEIYPVDLPVKFDLKTSFGFAPWEVLKKHYGSWHKDELKLYDQYFEAALEHRIDLHKIYIKFPEKDAKDPLMDSPPEKVSFNQQTKPLYAGQSHKKKYQMAVTDLPVPQEYKTVKNSENFWKKLNTSVVKNNFKERTFVYYADEPADEKLKSLGEELRQIKKWAPDVKFLAATPYHPALDGALDIWVINLFLWERPTEKSPAFYKQRQLQKNEELWFYVGCNSHGCTGAEDIQNPDFVTDRPSAYLRVFPWMALLYGAQGVLYYDTVFTYSHGGELSPWMDNFDFTGYGEGGLFYPCTLTLGQCKSPRVIPALRLKILRDGLEDVQILKMAQAKGFDTQIIKKVVFNAREFSVHNIEYEMIKRAALEFLSKAK